MASQTTRTLISPLSLARPRGKVVYRTLLALFIVGFGIIFIFPLYWMVIGGLKDTNEVIQSPPTFWPHTFIWSNFSNAWDDLALGHLLQNTLIYAFGALIFQLVFDVSAAYALSKLRPFLGNIVLFAMLTTLMIPATVLAVPAFLTALDMPFLHVNLTNTPWAIWLPSVANGFSIFLLKRFFDAVPEELIQAAAIDGAGPLRTMWSVVLPIARPVLAVISIFAVVNVWKDFLWPLLVLSGDHDTVNTGLVQLQNGTPPEISNAALVIASLPTIIFFLFFQRNILAGLGAGAIKD
jgi:multiple sugar transport system permease protein